MSLQQLFTGIADSIREKDDTTAPITEGEFPARILSLSVIKPPRTYGVEWDGTSTTGLTHTDDSAGFGDPASAIGPSGEGSSPFGNLYPWGGKN